MGLIDFVKDAGEKLFGGNHARDALMEASALPDAARVEAANDAAANAILAYLKTKNLPASGLEVIFDAATASVSVYGVAPDQPTREKIVLGCGNVAGVATVKDMMSVQQSTPEATFYTVLVGDSLAKIAVQFYGDAAQQMKIFDANKPMLTHPDRIYPGQKLRIPGS